MKASPVLSIKTYRFYKSPVVICTAHWLISPASVFWTTVPVGLTAAETEVHQFRAMDGSAVGLLETLRPREMFVSVVVVAFGHDDPLTIDFSRWASEFGKMLPSNGSRWQREVPPAGVLLPARFRYFRV